MHFFVSIKELVFLMLAGRYRYRNMTLFASFLHLTYLNSIISRPLRRIACHEFSRSLKKDSPAL